MIEQDALNTVEQPDGLVAFTVGEEAGKAAIRERLKGIGERIAGWFDDNRVVNAAVEGVYLPYWVFDALVEVSKTTIDRRTSSLYENRQQINPYLNEKYQRRLDRHRHPRRDLAAAAADRADRHVRHQRRRRLRAETAGDAIPPRSTTGISTPPRSRRSEPSPIRCGARYESAAKRVG